MVDDGGDGNLSLGKALFDPDDTALAADVDAVIGGDFRGESEGELEIGTGGRRRIEMETDAAGADIETLGGGWLHGVGVLAAGAIQGVGETDGERQAQREAAAGATFWLQFGHPKSLHLG